ncbi:MAG: DUF1254 domain-containing protein [Proteobacteria bacterium]|nr:DUF1254 domain-containing protein [Pseudomonadota bacterium]
MNYGVMYEYVIDKNSGQYKAPFNTISNEHRVFTYEDTAVITPNSDTPYSMVWMDLRAEPIVISVPAIEKSRYYSVMLCDGNTYNYGYIGSRATGNEAGDYMIVGPSYKGEPPSQIKKVFRSGTDFSLSIFRTQLFTPSDLPNVIKIQDQYKISTLSQYLKQPSPKKGASLAFPKIDKELVKTDFFEYLDFALQFSHPDEKDKAMLEKLALIGVGPGKKFNFKELSLKHKAEILLGMKEGENEIKDYLKTIGKDVNGWRVSGAGGDAAYYNGNWMLRAAVATAGIYANDAVEAMYPYARTDNKGQALDGSKHKYTITFAKDAFPPVNAFWSITMYDGKTQLLIKNPINRYLINSPMLPNMQKNKDGSITIYVQKDSPGKDKEANWLPAPNGPIYLVMRLYWPKESQPSILPPGEGSWAPPGIVVAD